MTITINPFIAGIVVTIVFEIVVVNLIAVISSMRKSHRNTSNSARGNKNE